MKYEALTFTIGDLPGISSKTIENHLGLYEGYVKHVNLIREKVAAFSSDMENNAFAIAEMSQDPRSWSNEEAPENMYEKFVPLVGRQALKSFAKSAHS